MKYYVQWYYMYVPHTDYSSYTYMYVIPRPVKN